MAVDGLLAVGGILSLALGVSGLILVNNQKLEVIWNKRFAAQLLCWIFICKGVANSLRSIGYENEFWRVVLYGGHFNDQIFAGLILMIALIFPVPILRTRKQFNIGVAVVLAYILLTIGAAVFMKVNTPLAAFTGLYLIPGFIWTLVYLKFRFMKGQEDNEEIQGVADVAVLLLVLMIGHILFRWVGMFAGSDYFYFMDLYGGNFANDYLWSQGLASAVIFGLVILCGEIYQASQGRVRTTSYIVFTYMAIGVLSHIVFRNVELFGSGGGPFTGTELEGLSSWQQIWSEITTTLHFTMMRPILGLYILFRYGLIRISEDNEQVGKATAIVLIVVATSALLEIVQSLIPLTEMLSAGILGIAIAFGIGWEERSFQSLISNPLRFPLRTKGAYFPELTFDKSEYYKLDKAMTAILIFFGFVAFILHWSQVEPF
ncbi:MAG: hypothetical protein VXY35_02370 [Candidatus Thermoplasmatota archaeon]|nr:hypothetical protein [Candidatus Thermoplasmatota archaeon]